MDSVAALKKGRWFNLRKFSHPRPIILALLFGVAAGLLLSCGGSEEEVQECEKVFNAAEGTWECVGQSGLGGATTEVDTANGNTSVAAEPTPVPTPVITNETAAGKELWVYLTKCISIEDGHLMVNTATKGNWLITPATDSPQEFGTWLIKPSGELMPHNSKAELWDDYLKGNCDSNIMSPAATDVITQTDASTVLWTQLAKCHPELPVSMLIAQRSQQTGDWVIVSDPNYAMDDYGVWSVKRDATIKPLNDRAKEVWTALSLSTGSLGNSSNTTEVAAGCTPVIRNEQEAKDRMYSYLSSCFPDLRQDEMITTRDPMKHVWLVVTNEPSADNTTEWKKSIWSVDGDGEVSPKNSSSKATQGIIDAKKC